MIVVHKNVIDKIESGQKTKEMMESIDEVKTNLSETSNLVKKINTRVDDLSSKPTNTQTPQSPASDRALNDKLDNMIRMLERVSNDLNETKEKLRNVENQVKRQGTVG
eukprot:TRINITY_DN12493_c0_g1_i7.p1 TRINITY_DN12493_c0_g1~~TRINITY_DN12493_c0_g1_i7.p1  ORF type:complete len:108 (+),score=30.23 TRINITY_DN12493_c0_g1_i7:98-421(+)